MKNSAKSKKNEKAKAKENTKENKKEKKENPKEDSEDYYTKEEIERLDKFHKLTDNKFLDEEIYDLMLKYKDDEDTILNELKEELKQRKRGNEFEWNEIGKSK